MRFIYCNKHPSVPYDTMYVNLETIFMPWFRKIKNNRQNEMEYWPSFIVINTHLFPLVLLLGLGEQGYLFTIRHDHRLPNH